MVWPGMGAPPQLTITDTRGRSVTLTKPAKNGYGDDEPGEMSIPSTGDEPEDNGEEWPESPEAGEADAPDVEPMVSERKS